MTKILVEAGDDPTTVLALEHTTALRDARPGCTRVGARCERSEHEREHGDEHGDHDAYLGAAAIAVTAVCAA